MRAFIFFTTINKPIAKLAVLHSDLLLFRRERILNTPKKKYITIQGKHFNTIKEATEHFNLKLLYFPK